VQNTTGNVVTIASGAAAVSGKAATNLKPGDDAVLVARPDDMSIAAAGIAAKVESVEYRGREFVGIARTSDDVELVFHAPGPLETGASVTLAPNPDRALVFAGAA
jgi:putative spermidine/putrescine transport system ATP-binding protein